MVLMFFGHGGSAADTKPDELYTLLNSHFDKKLRALDSRATGAFRGLNEAKRSYAEACEKFAAIEAEPDMEDMYVSSPRAIKEQKNSYVAVLIRILGEWDSGLAEGSNLHERWSIVLSRAEHFIEDTLRANSKFKHVLYSYSRHLDNFKRSFSSIERQKDLLKSALDRVGNELL